MYLALDRLSGTYWLAEGKLSFTAGAPRSGRADRSGGCCCCWPGRSERCGICETDAGSGRWGEGAPDTLPGPFARVIAALGLGFCSLRSLSSLFEYSSCGRPMSLQIASRYCSASMLSGFASCIYIVITYTIGRLITIGEVKRGWGGYDLLIDVHRAM